MGQRGYCGRYTRIDHHTYCIIRIQTTILCKHFSANVASTWEINCDCHHNTTERKSHVLARSGFHSRIPPSRSRSFPVDLCFSPSHVYLTPTSVWIPAPPPPIQNSVCMECVASYHQSVWPDRKVVGRWFGLTVFHKAWPFSALPETLLMSIHLSQKPQCWFYCGLAPLGKYVETQQDSRISRYPNKQLSPDWFDASGHMPGHSQYGY